MDFLKANLSALAGLPACTTTATQTCEPGDTSTYARYHATVTSGNRTYEVWARSPYRVTDTSAGGVFPEESMPTLANNPGEPTQQGCDQIGVVIKETSHPVLGSLTGRDTLTHTVRAVGRVKIQSGDLAPALLLLERTKCSVLTVGSAGSPSRISVAATGSTPATIHADSAATDAGCGSGSNQQLFQGKQANGIVAYGTGTVAGTITSVASQNGVPAATISDSTSNVYGTAGIYPATLGTPTTVTGRKQVTRRPVDVRYRSGVVSAVSAAATEWGKSHSSPAGYTNYINGCPTPAQMTTLAALTADKSVYIDCPGNGGITLSGSIGAGKIYFHGFIKNGALRMPNATEVYIDDTDNGGSRVNNDAISLTNSGSSFCIRASTCTAGSSVGQCSTLPTGSPTSKARLMIRRGMINGAGGSLLRLCNTTVVMEGGDAAGCVPATNGTAPSATPCGGGTGDGQINTSGSADWTAPNAYGDMAAAGITTESAKQALWSAGEDLALWTESYGASSSPSFSMAGGGNMHVAGVFMAPNANPFNITGGGIQDLSNAQYIVRSFAVAGGATLKMSVDPNNAVGLPTLFDFRLVR
ncbi:MAG: hypothetical protein HOQ22_17920 [Nocardioidaceae bacterium]|nr:hypothetical protein [Nocardioidaceae bacterium]